MPFLPSIESSKVLAEAKGGMARGRSKHGVTQPPLGEQEHTGVPRLAAHAAGLAGLAVKPLVKTPVSGAVRLGESHQGALRRMTLPLCRQREHPKAAHVGPDAAVVILVIEVLSMAGHVRPP